MSFNGFKNINYVKFHKDNDSKCKTPIGGLNALYSLNEINNDYWWAIKIPGDLICIDVDDDKEAEIVKTIIEHQKLKCYIEKSTRGCHFIFKLNRSLTKMKRLIRGQCLLTLNHIDYLTPSSNSTCICYKNNGWNDWIRYPENGILSSDNIDDVPIWLLPLLGLNNKPMNVGSYTELYEGERNDTLFKHSCRLAYIGANEDQIKEVITLINQYVLPEKLTDNEINTIINSSAERRQSSLKSWKDEYGQFQHNIMGDYLIKMLQIWRDEGGGVWYYNGEYYVNNEEALESEVIKLAPYLKSNQRQEVLKYIKLVDIESTFSRNENHNYIAVRNGLLNFATKKLEPFSPMYFVKTHLDINYIPDAYDEKVDKFLNDVLVDKADPEQRLIFEEYLGYTIFARDNYMKKMMLFIGETANNGKSTTQEMVMNLLGYEKYSSLKLFQINEKNKHSLSQLENKLANFDDDANDDRVKPDNLSYLKTLISSNSVITIDKKYCQPYKSKIYAKFWIASNHVIRTEQKGNEWMTRLLILQFNNTFKEDASILSNITTVSAKEYLLKLAVDGYNRLVKNGKFTVSKTSQLARRNYRLINDNVYKWANDNKGILLAVENLNGKSLDEIYGEYCSYMQITQPKWTPTGSEKFMRTIRDWGKDNNLDIQLKDNKISAVENEDSESWFEKEISNE